MKILVTAGNTQTPIDRVRCITNVFTGRTGTRIAQEAQLRGHDVHLLTSHPELAMAKASTGEGGGWRVSPFRTFDDLHRLMASSIPSGRFDAIIHCAAISDFQLAGVFASAAGARFESIQGRWHGLGKQLVDVHAGKVKSYHQELWLRMVPTPKLIDKIREPWNFAGVLVKFKLEVDVSDAELAEIAERSQRQSDADLIVANTYEGMHDWALLGRRDGELVRLERPTLAARLIDEVEALYNAARPDEPLAAGESRVYRGGR
jgi:phosphopantothenoylcysteine synthetase/decarboxylase